MNAASEHLVRIGRTCGALALAVFLSACGGGQHSTTTSVATGPDAFLGVWVADKAPRELLTVEGKAPPLNDAAAQLYSERKQRFATGDASFDQTTWCASPGMPRVMTMSYPFEIRQDGNHLAFIYGWYRWFRTVNMKSGAVDVPSPLTMGFPVGSWENDSLVIRTTGLIDTTVLDASGLPHSEMLTLTERLRVLPDGRLEDRITIEDPETFTEAWETALTFHRDAAARVTDDVCPDRMAAGEPAERTDSAAAVPTVKSVSTPRAEVTHSKTAMAPRLSGIWEPKTFVVMIPDAPLNSAGKEIADRNAAANKAGRILQTAWVSCRPGAVSTMTMPREKIVILESSDEITMLFEMPRMVRRIRLDATHPDNLVPSYVGDSVGRWEGNTLVVDSVGFNGFAELDARGLPTSPKLHTAERFSVASDGSVEVETTITDPEYYDRPLTIKRSWKKSEASHPLEYDCSENPRQEDFENAYYVRERYRPVCMRVEGEGMELSRMVCDRPK